MSDITETILSMFLSLKLLSKNFLNKHSPSKEKIGRKFIIPKNQSAVSLFIISECKEEICQYIHDELSRGTTIIKAKGGYTNNEKDVILTVIEKKQYRQLEKELEKIDKHAFVIISDAKEIKGEGFTYEYRI